MDCPFAEWISRATDVTTKVLCIANQKGGVGKTTTSICLATALAKAGQRVLVVDLDPQCNATSGLGLATAPKHPLLEPEGARHRIVESATKGLDLLPGSRLFRDADSKEKEGADDSAKLAKNLMSVGFAKYDWVIVDSPPSLGPLTRAALACADELLIPIQSEFFAMEGLTQMIEVVRDIMAKPNNRLSFGGILLTMHDPQLELSHDVENEVREFFGEIVFSTMIPRDVAVAEAPSHGVSVLDYAPRSRGAWAYCELCQEVLGRE